MQGSARWLWEDGVTRWPAVVAGWVTALCIALAATTGHCQEKDELARRHFESGAAYFAEAEYEEALKAFQKAYELSNRPQILLNVSVVQERLGNLRGAVSALDEYLTQNPTDPEIETIRLRRDNLAKRIEDQARRERETERTSPVEPAAPEPPPGADATTRPTTPPDDEARRDAPSSGASRAPAYVLLSIGGLAGIGALVTGWGAQSEYDDLEGSCGGACSADQTSTGEALALTSTVLTGVAVVAVGVGALLWLGADDEAKAQSSAPRLLVGAGQDGGYAEARWSF